MVVGLGARTYRERESAEGDSSGEKYQVNTTNRCDIQRQVSEQRF